MQVKNSHNWWSRREETLLRNMVVAGHREADIARAFNRTVASVHRKIQRMIEAGRLEGGVSHSRRDTEDHHLLPRRLASMAGYARPTHMPPCPPGRRWVSRDGGRTWHAEKN